MTNSSDGPPGALAERHDQSLADDDADRPHTDDALVSARQITLTRGQRAVLDHVDIDILPGEIVTLIGPNGAGKTTLARVLLGIERASAGTVRRRGGLVVGYVPQRFDLDRAIPMTVERFLMLPGVGMDADVRAAALAAVGAPQLSNSQFSALSGGELQRVLLARALLRQPQLLVLDEPVRGVDFAGEAELYALIATLRSERGLGVLLISHDLHMVMAQSDRVVCLNRHVCCSGVPDSVAHHPEFARLFGPQAARALGVYTHVHNHRHDLAGDAGPARGRDKRDG